MSDRELRDFGCLVTIGLVGLYIAMALHAYFFERPVLLAQYEQLQRDAADVDPAQAEDVIGQVTEMNQKLAKYRAMDAIPLMGWLYPDEVADLEPIPVPRPPRLLMPLCRRGLGARGARRHLHAQRRRGMMTRAQAQEKLDRIHEQWQARRASSLWHLRKDGTPKQTWDCPRCRMEMLTSNAARHAGSKSCERIARLVKLFEEEVTG